MSIQNRPKGSALLLRRAYLIAIFITAWGLWLTGGLWLIYHYYMRLPGKFGTFRSNPLEEWWLIAHGGFAVLGTFFLGFLWSPHIMTGWNLHWRRKSGGTLAGATIFLVLTGYLIYYIGNQQILDWTVIAHWVVGLAAIALFFIHWLSKSKPRGRG